MNQVLRVISASNLGIHSKGNPITRVTFQYKKIHISQWFHHSKPLDLSYKEDSPRADTKIQSSLLPKGSNPDTFREEEACCKKIWMVQNIVNPLLASALLPDMFCNKNNAISPEAIGGGETTTVPHPKKLLTRLPPALYQDNQDGCDVRSKGGGLRENKCLCCSQTLF